MGIDIIWDGSDLHLGPVGPGASGPGTAHSTPLLSRLDPEQRRIVEGWAAQADSLPEFLEMLHLEGFLELTVLSQMLADRSPLCSGQSRGARPDQGHGS